MKKNNTEGNKKAPSKVLKVFYVVLADILLLGVCLCTFAYFHHVMPRKSAESSIVITIPTEIPVQAAQTPSPDAESSAEPTEEIPLTWKEKFADKFASDGSVIQTANSFISGNTHVTITRHEKTITRDFKGEMVDYLLVYYVADIYITDVNQLVAAFPKGEYIKSATGSTLKQVTSNNGIVGVNGDNCGSRTSFIIRNYEPFGSEADLFEVDMMVLYYDGTMDAIFYNDIDLNEIAANGPYQAWSFGPVLVKDGQMVSDYRLPDYIEGDNPRTAIGYYEPGHYCLVVVEGREPSDSLGASLSMLSEIFYELGCNSAYNLDGGATSAMVFNDDYVNVRAGGGRYSTDTILIVDPDYVKEGN